MPTQKIVVLLRGVNVGGKRLPMADFRRVLADLGYADAVTYLQSGNAVVTAAARPAAVAEHIRAGLAKGLGLSVAVITRSAAELDAAVAADPLGSVADAPARHVIGFLTGLPGPGRLAALRDRLQLTESTPERLEGVGAQVYLWCPNGISKAATFTVNWAKSLGVEATMRNWTTVTALRRLAADTHPSG